GSDSVQAIAQPKIGVYFGGPDDYPQFGSVWYTFEKVFGIPFVPLQSLGDIDDFSCVILPGGRVPQTDATKEWIQRGGTAVLFGGNGGGLANLGRSSQASGGGRPLTSLP